VVGGPAAEEPGQSHHEIPFTLGVETVGGVLSTPVRVAVETGLMVVLLPVATATTL
jgi:hypothetical protein